MKPSLLTLLAAAALACPATAGTAVSAKSFKQPKNPIVPTKTCFADHELSVDTFASFQTGPGEYLDDAFGGGIALNCFWNRYFGFSLEGNWNEGTAEGSVLHSVSGLFVLRAPVEGALCFAPYVFAGGGGHFDSENQASGQAGGGVEVRVSDKIGVFGDGRVVLVDDETPGLFRLGLRWLF